MTTYIRAMKHFLRTTILAAVVAVPLAARADTPEAAPVQTLDTALIATMKAGSAGQSFQARFSTLDPVVEQSYDLDEVTKNSVGFLWNTLPADQQEQLDKLFAQFTVASYVAEFGSYSGEQINLLPNEKALGQKKIIETQIMPGGGGSPTAIDYVVADGDNGWRITDVLLNGTISQVAIHSSDFSSLVTSGDASQLITALKSKIAALSSGSAGDQ